MADLQRQIDLILTELPELSAARFSLLGEGWDSLALESDTGLVFKFPKTQGAAQALRREAALLGLVRPAVDLPVPDMRLFGQGPIFSRHVKLVGGHLTTADYVALDPMAQAELALTLGQFYAQLHALDPQAMRDAGALPIGPWLPPHLVCKAATGALTGALLEFALRLADAFEALPPDPFGQTYGYFDGHGWNMAFDHGAQRLNGLYDFADSGFGPLHQEFVYSSFIARDLTLAIMAQYQRLTGRRLDPERIDLLTGYLRLSEWAEARADDGATADRADHLWHWAQQTRGLYRWGLPED